VTAAAHCAHARAGACPPGRLRRAAAAALLVIVGLLAACDAPAQSVAPTPTRAPDATPIDFTYELGTDVWYEGLVLHVARARTILSPAGGTVDVFMTIENPGQDPSALDAGFSLVVGATRLEPTRDSQVPSIPGGESRLALVSFELQEIASAADAVLEIGAAPNHVGKVPFSDPAGQAVRFQPIDLELKGNGTAGDLKLTLRRGVVRWDLPDWSEELPATLRVLTVTYDATYSGSFSGGYPFTGENVALRLPNGDIVESREDGHSQSIELIGSRKTKKNLISRFEIPVDATGEFALIVRAGGTERAIKFTIGG
jgi:hypothetical protein